jgi:hypothetical protein
MTPDLRNSTAEAYAAAAELADKALRGASGMAIASHARQLDRRFRYCAGPYCLRPFALVALLHDLARLASLSAPPAFRPDAEDLRQIRERLLGDACIRETYVSKCDAFALGARWPVPEWVIAARDLAARLRVGMQREASADPSAAARQLRDAADPRTQAGLLALYVASLAASPPDTAAHASVVGGAQWAFECLSGSRTYAVRIAGRAPDAIVGELLVPGTDGECQCDRPAP